MPLPLLMPDVKPATLACYPVPVPEAAEKAHLHQTGKRPPLFPVHQLTQQYGLFADIIGITEQNGQSMAGLPMVGYFCREDLWNPHAQE